MTCVCNVQDRKLGERQRDWLKRCLCMRHWMETDYYQAKLEPPEPPDTGSDVPGGGAI
jgi:hypothetical protein